MKIYVMDAFAAKLFGGNQAGVALPERDVSDETMRLIAAELKHCLLYTSDAADD